MNGLSRNTHKKKLLKGRMTEGNDPLFLPPVDIDGEEQFELNEEEEEGESENTARAGKTIHITSEYQKHLIPSGDDSRKLVMLAPQELINSGFDLIKLPHPRTGKLQKYALSRASTGTSVVGGPRVLYELQKLQNPQGSWFVREHESVVGSTSKEFALSDGYIITKGALLLASPVDPTFIVLKSFIESSVKRKGEFLSYKDIITFGSEHDAELRALTGDVDLLFDGVNAVCDTFKVADETFYKYSEAKTVDWLKLKAEAVKDALKAPGCPLGYLAEAGSFSASYRRENGIHMTDATLTSAALGFLSEYIPGELLAVLANKAYGIDDYKVPKKSLFSPVAAGPAAKKFHYKYDYHKRSEPPEGPQHAPQKKVQKYQIVSCCHKFYLVTHIFCFYTENEIGNVRRNKEEKRRRES